MPSSGDMAKLSSSLDLATKPQSPDEAEATVARTSAEELQKMSDKKKYERIQHQFSQVTKSPTTVSRQLDNFHLVVYFLWGL